MALTVYDRKSFGKDKHLGEADVEVRKNSPDALVCGLTLS
jgi:hypothetical protein